jgi:membrane-associated phospholipid phosphatase
LPLERSRRVREIAPAILAGAALFAVSGAAAKRSDLHAAERQAFAAINQLDDAAHRPVWMVMQAGSLGAVGAAAALAWVAGRRNTAVALGVSGSAVWGGAKVVKQLFGRGRPADHIPEATIRGRPASGLGFPSGHAAVATALAVIGAPDLGPIGRAGAYSVAGLTAVARVYVGAHLPADVVGGVGMGLALGAITNAARFSRAIPSR